MSAQEYAQTPTVLVQQNLLLDKLYIPAQEAGQEGTHLQTINAES